MLQGMRQSKLSYDDLVNMWLEPYHNTNLDEVQKKHGWNDGKDHSREFYSTYAVTQEQHDEWYEKVIAKLSKESKLSKKYIKKIFLWTYLNVAPSIK